MLYPDGQSVYIRLNKQLKKATAAVRRGVSLYNGVIGMSASLSTFPASVTEKQVYDLTAFSCITGMCPVCSSIPIHVVMFKVIECLFCVEMID